MQSAYKNSQEGQRIPKGLRRMEFDADETFEEWVYYILYNFVSSSRFPLVVICPVLRSLSKDFLIVQKARYAPKHACLL